MTPTSILKKKSNSYPEAAMLGGPWAGGPSLSGQPRTWLSVSPGHTPDAWSIAGQEGSFWSHQRAHPARVCHPNTQDPLRFTPGASPTAAAYDLPQDPAHPGGSPLRWVLTADGSVCSEGPQARGAWERRGREEPRLWGLTMKRAFRTFLEKERRGHKGLRLP